MAARSFGIRKGLISILIGIIAVSFGAVFLAQRTVQKTMDEYASETAISWGTYLAENLRDLDTIAFGLPPSPRSLSILQTSQQVGDIFRYKIFNEQGQLVLISDDLSFRREGDTDRLADHNPQAAAVLETGIAYIDVRQGDGETRPFHYSEAYVPLIAGGETVGIIEVYVDQTHFRANLLSSFSGLSLQLLLAMGLAFGVPAAWFWRRTREQEATQNKLDHISDHDRLTGTQNRARFNKEVEQAVNEHPAVTVYACDLDHFKAINDVYGFHVGDAVLKQASERLVDLVGDSGIVGRPSGDEFAICQPQGNCPADSCADFALMIRQTLSIPYVVGDQTIECRSSVGFAASPKHGNTASDLSARANVALDHAKASGRNCSVVYEQSLEQQRRDRLELEQLLREAVREDRFYLNYQPQFDTGSGTLVGFEALLRLKNAQGDPISPDVFIPVVEDLGLIVTVGEMVLRKACSFAALWPRDVAIAVNLSAIQFEDGQLVDTVQCVLSETQLAPEQLELEITESLLIDDTGNVINQLHQLRMLGIKVALDDFGTGYSSLSYLWQFPFDRLKIDRSFVMQIESPEGKAYDILQSIVSLARALNLEVTAEGVETLDQLEVLKGLQASHSQGFLLGRPLEQADVPAFILSKATASFPKSDNAEIANRVSLVS